MRGKKYFLTNLDVDVVQVSVRGFWRHIVLYTTNAVRFFTSI